MNKREIAEELLNIRAGLLRVAVNRKMNEFARGEIYVLDLLLNSSGPIYPKDLSKKMEVSTARIAAILNQMEAKGWVQRTPDPGSTKQTLVILTEDGRAHIQEKREDILLAIERMLDRIGDEDAAELLRIQRKMIQ